MALHSPSAVVLLGAQRFDPSLGAAVSKLRVGGRIALVTAGWQERESEDEELAAHLGGNTVNLTLHARGDDVFRRDDELRAAHRERGEALRHRQDFYRIRLEHEIDVERVLEKRVAPDDLAAEEAQATIEAIQELDARHLAQCARVHAAFEARWKPAERPAVKKHRKEVAALVEGCDAIAIAGGHVASLVNRLNLFGLRELVSGRIIFAWSGGAMAISDRVVLFHDDPPQGPGVSEILDAGLGLCPGVVVLPQPETRLRLDQKSRVRSMARRFAPALCLAFPASSRVTWRDGRFSSPDGVVELRADGEHGPFVPQAEAT